MNQKDKNLTIFILALVVLGAVIGAVFNFSNNSTEEVVESESDGLSVEELSAMYLRVAKESHREGIDSLEDPAFSAFVYDTLDKQCPFYVPSGAGYRDCLWEAVYAAEGAYTKERPSKEEIEDECQQLALHLGGLVAGEVILSCRVFKLSQ